MSVSSVEQFVSIGMPIFSWTRIAYSRYVYHTFQKLTRSQFKYVKISYAMPMFFLANDYLLPKALTVESPSHDVQGIPDLKVHLTRWVYV